MLNPVFQAVNSNNPYERLISVILQAESEPLADIQQQRNQVRSTKSVLSDFDSTLSSLDTLLDTFTDQITNPFAAKSSLVSEDASFSAAATDDADLGTYSLQVQRLASVDTRISQQLSSTGTSLRAFFDANGAQTFGIEVASPTDEDPSSRTTINVSVDPAGATDAEILREIDNAIASAMSAAVNDGTIESSQTVSASVLSETSDTSRLTVRSGQTGYANRIDFTDSAGGLLNVLQINSADPAEGTGGGQVKRVGTGEADSDLNSQFTLDGLTIYRSGNVVSDLLDGVTLTLSATSETATDVTIAPDTESIESQVNDFIETYNGVLQFIQERSRVDGDTGFRGAFAGDATFTGLRNALRTDLAEAVTGQPAAGPTFLTDLGIDVANDGTLTLSDPDTLTALVEENPTAVQSLFASEDGLATRLTTRIAGFLGSDGIISNRDDVLESRINRFDDRVDTFNDRLAARESQLREQFAQVQESLSLLQGQQSTIGSFL